jgi:hypothetical protein
MTEDWPVICRLDGLEIYYSGLGMLSAICVLLPLVLLTLESDYGIDLVLSKDSLDGIGTFPSYWYSSVSRRSDQGDERDLAYTLYISHGRIGS